MSLIGISPRRQTFFPFSKSGSFSWLGILLLLALAGAAYGEARLRTFRVNISIGGYPPYLILNPDGSVDGVSWQVLQEALPNHEILAYQFPRKRVDGLILEGHVEATFRAPAWTLGAARFILSAPILEVRDALFSRRAAPLVYGGPESLENKRILTHLGYHYAARGPAFASGLAERHDVADEEDMFRRLMSGGGLPSGLAGVTCLRHTRSSHPRLGTG